MKISRRETDRSWGWRRGRLTNFKSSSVVLLQEWGGPCFAETTGPKVCTTVYIKLEWDIKEMDGVVGKRKTCRILGGETAADIYVGIGLATESLAA